MLQSLFSLIGALAVLAACVPLLSSCAFTSRVLRTDPENQSVPGLRAALNETAGEGGTLRVFLVHGMSNHPYGDKNAFSDTFDKDVADYPALLEKMKSPAWRNGKKADFIKAIVGSQFTPLIPNLAATLGLHQEEGVELQWLTGNGEQDVIGYQLRRPFRGVVDGQERRVVFYVSSWAHTCLEPKSELARHEEYPERKYPIANKGIKDGLVTWGLMDAALYVGTNRHRMEEAVAQGLSAMWAESAGQSAHDRYVFVSASLGSIITLNTLTRILNEAPPAGTTGKSLSPEAVITMLLPPKSGNSLRPPASPASLHMLANQVPLLAQAVDNGGAGLKATDAEGAAPSETPLEAPQATALRGFARALSQALGQAKSLGLEKQGDGKRQLNVIAYTDPADLLSFQIRKRDLPGFGELENVNIELTNVLVRNPAFGIRPLFSWPLSAHSDFDKSPAVIWLMAEGKE